MGIADSSDERGQQRRDRTVLRKLVIIYAENPDLYSQIAARFPELEVEIYTCDHHFIRAVEDAEIIFMARKFSKEMLQGAKRLKWLHLAATGIDRLLPLSDFSPELIITNSKGIRAEMISNYVICVILMLLWDFPRMMRNQGQKVWRRWPVARIEGKVLGILGLGNIGQAIARRAKSFGMVVTGTRRSMQPLDDKDLSSIPIKSKHDLLSAADFVVLVVSLTPETQGMMGKQAFETMKESAYLINVSRGAVVQERELIAALREKKIAGAVLDVTEQEPLPPESELWSLENVIITPHISSSSTDSRERAAELFCKNLYRYLRHEKMLNVIDRAKGY
jgi:phosphoglycerate dehydrogenase-like enzyme